MKILETLNKVYCHSPIEVRKKAAALIILNAVLIAVFFTAMVLLEIIFNHSKTGVLLEACVIVALFAGIRLTLNGHFFGASLLSLVSLFVSTTALALTSKAEPIYLAEKLTVLHLPVIAYACLTGYRLRQPIIASILAFASLWIYYIFFCPGAGLLESAVERSVLISNSLVLISSGIIGALTLKLSKDALQFCEKQIQELGVQAKSLEEAKSRAVAIFDFINDAVFLHDADSGNIIDVNPKAVELSGYSREELMALSPDDEKFGRSPHGIKAVSYIKAAVEGQPQLFDWLAQKKNGQVIWAEINMRSALIGEKKQLIVSLRDITTRKQMEEKLASNQKLESIGILAGGIAHDFNNLLSGMYGYLELARIKTASKGGSTEDLDKAFSVFSRARSLAQQLLTFSKGHQPVKKQTELGAILRRCAEFNLSGTSITYEIALESELPPCEADENQISQVFDNIILNARQAMNGGGHITIRAGRFVNPPAEVIRMVSESCLGISIKDNGPGIRHEDLKRIFDPFFTTKSHGNGLGLAISHSIIAKHGGCITVESEPGKGAEFLIYLPVAGKSESVTASQAQQPGLSVGRILVMDDEPAVLETACRLLISMGHSVEKAGHGKEAVELVKSELQKGSRFDLAILDLTVRGGLGGKEIIRDLKKLDYDMPVLASSGYAVDPVMAKPEEFGFDGRLPKPYMLSELSGTVTMYLKNNGSEAGR